MRNLRYPFGRDVAPSFIQTRSKRGRVKEILARRESAWRLLVLVAIVIALTSVGVLLA